MRNEAWRRNRGRRLRTGGAQSLGAAGISGLAAKKMAGVSTTARSGEPTTGTASGLQAERLSGAQSGFSIGGIVAVAAPACQARKQKGPIILVLIRSSRFPNEKPA